MKADIRNPFRLPRPDLARIALIGIGQSGTAVALVFLMRAVIDRLISAPGELGSLFRLLGMVALVILLDSWFRTAEFGISERMGYEVVRKLRMTMYDHMRGFLPRGIQRRSRGALLLRLTGDLTMLRTWISRGIARGIVSGIVVVVVTTVLTIMDVWIGLALIGVLLAGAAISLSAGERLRRTTRKVRRKRSLLTSNVDEQVNSLASIQVFGRAPGESSRLSRQNESLTSTLFREATIRARLRGISSGTGWLGVAIVLAVGAIEVASTRASVGLVVAAITAVRQVTGHVRNLGLSHDYWQRAEVSKSKVLDFLNSGRPQVDGQSLARLRVRRGRIEFRDVTVEGAIRGVSAVAEPRELVAVTGPTGAGKSTLLSLLARMIEPDSGQVVIDDQVLADCTPNSTYRYVGMVSPDLPLMRGTVERNLTYRMPGASEEEVRRVAMAWRLDDVLSNLPDGMSSWITEGGKNLSGGQRQRLMLSRALMGNPPILLLDEPGTSLDPAGKAILHRALARHLGTTLLVTNDPEEVALADKVWVMDSGSIVEVLTGEAYSNRLWRLHQRSAG